MRWKSGSAFSLKFLPRHLGCGSSDQDGFKLDKSSPQHPYSVGMTEKERFKNMKEEIVVLWRRPWESRRGGSRPLGVVRRRNRHTANIVSARCPPPSSYPLSIILKQNSAVFHDDIERSESNHGRAPRWKGRPRECSRGSA